MIPVKALQPIDRAQLKIMEPESTTRNSTNQGLQPDANDDTENLKNDITTNQQTQTSSTTPTPSSNDEPLESAADKEDTSSPAFTRSKRKQRDGDNNSTATNNTSNDTKGNNKRAKSDLPPQPYAEAYVQLANQMIFTMDDKTRQVMESLDLPGNALSGLGYLKSGLRTPTVLEQWSPWEIGLFQAGLAHHGKEFHLVQKEVKSKSTQEVLDFYLVWKKTSAYKQWKKDYLPPYLDMDEEEEAESTIDPKK